MKKFNRASLNDAQNFSLVKREAIYTGIALIGLIIFWFIAGFGTSALEIRIFHVPLWAILGSIGVWLVAILISAILSKKLFTDIDFGGENDD